MKIDFKLVDQLKSLSLTSTYRKSPIASALVYRGNVISFGINQMKTHPYQRKYGRNTESIFWHAETNALYIADKKLHFDKFDKSVIYVVRTKWDGTDKKNLINGLAFPCEGCIRCIKNYGIKSIIYTLDQIGDEKCNMGVFVL